MQPAFPAIAIPETGIITDWQSSGDEQPTTIEDIESDEEEDPEC